MVSWTPHPENDRQTINGEVLHSKLPLAINVHSPGATWTVHEQLGRGVCTVMPVSRTWVVNKRTNTKVRRTGFFIVPDFASTAHMIQGQSLEAAFVDIVNDNFFEKPNDELQVAGYTMVSRAKYLERVWIMHPFSQCLFTQGPPAGPHILLRKLQCEILAEEAAEEWRKKITDTGERKQTPDDPMKALYSCTQCFLRGDNSHAKPAAAFGVFPQTNCGQI